MTDKERLEEIETKYSTLTVSSEKNSTEYTEVDVEDLVFLIQTCWNATGGMTIDYESLTDRHVNITKEILEEYQEENERLEQQNQRYREALEFYADEEHYKEKLISEAQYDADGICISNDEYAPPIIYFDSGEIARKALEGET